jgi:predicted DNA-binding helix-hairpin-helix protein
MTLFVTFMYIVVSKTMNIALRIVGFVVRTLSAARNVTGRKVKRLMVEELERVGKKWH